MCKARGVPPEVAARLAGHANIQLTAMLYGQLDEDALQQIYDAKIGAWGGAFSWPCRLRMASSWI